TKTKNIVGVYKGWIYLNDTDSHPYPYFNLSLEVELTDKLKIDYLEALTADGNNVKENPTTDENITLLTKIFFANNTEITNLILDNFTNIYLEEGNVTFYKIDPLKILNGSSPTEVWNGSLYKINITIPGNKAGGQYKVYLTTNYHTGVKLLTQTASWHPLIIRDSGLLMEFIGSPPSTLANGTSGTVNVSIKNYGPVNASAAKIKLTPGDKLSSTTALANSNCDSSSFSNNEWTFNLSSYNPVGCWAAWKITAGQTNGTTTSTIAGIAGAWYRSLNFDTVVTKPEEVVVTPPPPPTYVANLEFIRAETLIIVQQNSTNSTIVEVKNTGNKTLDVTFSIENINTTWYSLNDTFETLTPNQIATFNATFIIGDVELKDYSGKYMAASPDKTITKDFILRILPSEAKKVEINTTLAEFKLNYTQLEEEINQTKTKGFNVTLAEEKLTQLKSKIEEAETYIAKGDYTSAYNIFNAIRLLIGETRGELEKAKEVKVVPPPAIPWNLIIPIVIGIVVAIILAYLFWPVKPGYKPEEKIFVKEKEVAPKKRLEIIKTKLKAFKPKLRVKPPEKVKPEKEIKPEEAVEEEWKKLYKKYKK
ncbi:MAG: hypothetical protein QMD14_05880, partial [Candidatus Aenigmarchaeota archaeon]|nr:hypothetical protein [Candidatus Aenigmarchaeota archaeon]